MLTQERVRELFDYNPKTGKLIRRVRVANRTHVGDVINGLTCEGYVRVYINCKSYQAHRIIWLWLHGCFPEQIDHINHIRNDNREINLREVNNQVNKRNETMRINNISGFTGVSWHNKSKKWHSQISIDGRCRSLGYFTIKDDAIAARKAANLKHGYHANHGK